jgi:hypothetical protein
MNMLPSVTEIIEPWVDFSKVPPATLKAAGERGTAVHEACALYAQGIPVLSIPPEISGYVESYKRWFDQLIDEVILVEERLFDYAIGYNGQLDLVARTKGCEVWLVDLKSPVTLSKSWRVQLSAYKNLYERMGEKIDRSGTLRLRSDGKIPKMDWYEGGAAKDFNIFLSALNCHRFYKG